MNADTAADPTVYVDPYPGRKGSDTVAEKCGNCDNGIYAAPTRLKWSRNGVEAPWCLACEGSGTRPIKVSSVRARVRRAANQAKRDRELAPYRDWLAAEARYLEIVAAEDAAYAEDAAREARKTGYLAEVGAKVTDLTGEITTAYRFDASDFRGREITKMMLVVTLADGKVVKWVSGGSAAFGLWSGETFRAWERGDTVRIDRAIVKKHTVYRKTGQEQTELKNVKLTLLVPANPGE
ncbi:MULTISPECIES: hypothetical protein [unclassified Nocardia]|uniref:hypothetical protein n=1 Tax=unclassified Nocardia TaxID=2637762 RepID=UPI00278BC989|nr:MULTISPECIES: hypothetical protein [unclassified Nocardia]